MEEIHLISYPENRLEIETLIQYYSLQGWDITVTTESGNSKTTTLIWPYDYPPLRLPD